MLIGLHRKRLETPLVHRARSRGVAMSMPALRMRDGNPPQHLGQLHISSRPEQDVPVIRHEAIGRDAYVSPVVGLGQNLLKGGVVRGLFKQWESTDSAVEHMIDKVSSSEAGAAGHATLLATLPHPVKKRLPTPFQPCLCMECVCRLDSLGTIPSNHFYLKAFENIPCSSYAPSINDDEIRIKVF